MATNPLTEILGRLRAASTRTGADRVADPDLLHRFVGEQDAAAFEALLARHGPMVLSVCRRALSDPGAIDDAFQATFLILLQKARRLRRSELLGNWLYGVACRIAARKRAEAARRSAREANASVAPSDDPLDAMSARELYSVIDEEISRLPARYRAAVVACYLEEKTRDDAAADLGWSLATLGRRLSRGRALLRARFSRRGISRSAAWTPLVLADAVAGSAVPRTLSSPILKAASLFASRNNIPPGIFRAEVQALSRKVADAMVLSKLTKGAVLFFSGTLLAIGLGGFSFHAAQGREEKGVAEAPPAPRRGEAPAKESRSRSVLQGALEAVKGIESSYEQVAALVRIAQGQSKLGEKEPARQTLQQALKIAESLDAKDRRGLAFREIAETRLQLGDVADATAIADLVHDQLDKNQFLFALASAQAQAGDLQGALKNANSITDYQKDNALVAVAQAAAQAGDLDAARKLSDDLKRQPLSRASALEAIALAQAKQGDKKAAAESLHEALRLEVATLADPVNRIGARAEIAILQARIGDVAGALRAASALETGRETGLADRVHALRGIANAQAEQGDRAGAQQTIAHIPDLAERARAFVALAESFAASNDGAAARKMLAAAVDIGKTISGASGDDLLEEIHAAQARSEIRAGNLKDALSLVESIHGVQGRCLLLVDLARAQEKASDHQGALASLVRAMKAADGLLDKADNQEGVITLVPVRSLVKGSVVRQVAAAAAQAGDAASARAWASRQQSAFLKAMIALGISEGLAGRDGSSAR